MSEKPLERLNYFNGQRLQAGDFKLEQDYHMRVRRWLNRSLYTPGIAMGLEVYPVPGAAMVRVNPGLAIDHLGREIILLDSRDVPVMHGIGNNKRSDGSYLVIRYAEQVLSQQDACCVPEGTGGDKAAQGGPSRVLAEPVLECVPDLPHAASGKILLGRVVLADGCGSIAHIDTSVRHYVGDASAAKVRQYALEGFRDIDANNSATVRFHVRGRQPSSVTLVLRSEPFPSYFYSEMGKHSHVSSATAGATTGPASDIDRHTHSGASLSAISDTHDHTVWGYASNSSYNGAIPPTPLDIPGLVNLLLPYPDGPIMLPVLNSPVFPPGTPKMMLRMVTTVGVNSVPPDIPRIIDLGDKVGMDVRDVTGHGHSITGNTGDPTPVPAASGYHNHSFSASINESGVDVAARSGAALTCVEALEVLFDNHDVTAQILIQVNNNRPPGENWSALGTGSGNSNDPLFATGTGDIQLSYIVPIDESEHTICFKVPRLKSNGKPNGGRIHYNLYIE